MLGRTSLLVAALILFNAGCGSNAGRLKVHPASGKVMTRGGAPCKGAIVVLHPQAGSPAAQAGLLSSGHVGDDGSFKLSTFGQDDGVPAGEYTVAVRWPEDPANPKAGGKALLPVSGKTLLPPTGGPPDRLKGKYNDPARSKFKATIKEGENALPVIELD